MLAAGSEVDAVDALDWTSAHVTTLDGNVAALRARLGAGTNVHTRDVDGYHPLMASDECRRPEAVAPRRVSERIR